MLPPRRHSLPSPALPASFLQLSASLFTFAVYASFVGFFLSPSRLCLFCGFPARFHISFALLPRPLPPAAESRDYEAAAPCRSGAREDIWHCERNHAAAAAVAQNSQISISPGPRGRESVINMRIYSANATSRQTHKPRSRSLMTRPQITSAPLRPRELAQRFAVFPIDNDAGSAATLASLLTRRFYPSSLETPPPFPGPIYRLKQGQGKEVRTRAAFYRKRRLTGSREE